MKSGKRFLFVTRTLTGGGAERFVATFASYLADRDEDVYIISYEKSKNDYVISENVKLFYLPDRKRNFYRKITRITDTRKIIKKTCPDIIIPFINSVMFCSWIASWGTKSKLIYTVRVSPWDREGTILTDLMERIVAKYSNAIMVQTNEQGDYFRNKYENKIHVVPNPVSDRFIKSQKNKYGRRIKKIMMVGRLDRQKNYELAINLFEKLHHLYPDLILEIYGEGPDKSSIQDILQKKGLLGVCVLKGRSNTIEKEMLESDAFLMTSDYEGMPNALMEAMTIGLPCISSDCRTGPKDLIDDGKTGYLFQTGNIDSLYEKCLIMLQNPQLAEKIGKEAREHMLKNFSLEITTNKFMQMVNHIWEK